MATVSSLLVFPTSADAFLGLWKVRPRLSHVSVLLPPLQYVLQLCKWYASHFLLCFVINALSHLTSQKKEHKVSAGPVSQNAKLPGLHMLASPSKQSISQVINKSALFSGVCLFSGYDFFSTSWYSRKTWTQMDRGRARRQENGLLSGQARKLACCPAVECTAVLVIISVEG